MEESKEKKFSMNSEENINIKQEPVDHEETEELVYFKQENIKQEDHNQNLIQSFGNEIYITPNVKSEPIDSVKCLKQEDYTPNLNQYYPSIKPDPDPDTKMIYNPFSQTYIINKGFKLESLTESDIQLEINYLASLRNDYSCHICGKVLSNRFNVKQHILKVHKELKTMICRVCGEATLDSAHLQSHLYTHLQEPTKPFPCSFCSSAFMLESGLKEHEQIFHVQDLMKRDSNANQIVNEIGIKIKQEPGIEIEDEVVENPSTVNIHKLLMNSEIKAEPESFEEGHDLQLPIKSEPIETKIDNDENMIVLNAKLMKKHKLKDVNVYKSPKTGHTEFQCKICGKVAGRKFTIKYHMDSMHYDQDKSKNKDQPVNSSGNKFQCIQCESEFDLIDQLDKHMGQHPVKRYKCNDCKKVFKMISYLRRHLEVHQGAKPFICDTCGRGFIKKRYLNKHMEIHVNQEKKIHSCDKCDEKFFKWDMLVKHKLVHGEENLEKCDQCDKVFTCSELLKKHKKTHIPKNFPCHLCSKKFVEGERLILHLERHKFRDFKCDYCPKAFMNLHTLKIHMLIHTGVKEFNCSACEMKFFHRSKMIIHQKSHTENAPYKCDQCEREFGNLGDLGNHQKTHVENKYKCEHCSEEFNNILLFRAHELIHNKNSYYKCRKCGLEFFGKVVFKKHMEEDHTDGKTFKCVKCELKFYYNSNMIKHMKLHIEDAPYECELCHKHLPSLGHLEFHKKKHGIALSECDICHKKFTSDFGFRRHMNLHKDGKPFLCTVCTRGYISEEKLQTHMLVHTGEKKNKCYICQKAFFYESTLSKHIRTVHVDLGPIKCEKCNKTFQKYGRFLMHQRNEMCKILKCEECGKIFSQNFNYQRHLLVHSKEKPFQCEICDKGFPEKGKLKAHMALHGESLDKKYKCEICSKEFTHEAYFNKHILAHSTEEVNKCDQCDKSFQTAENLESHKSTHIPKHQCNECGKTFSHLYNYRRHLLIHTGEKPFRCDICGKGFTEKVCLNNHVKARHTDTKDYVCEICGKGYISKGNLKSHMVNHFAGPIACDVCGIELTTLSRLKYHTKKYHPELVEGPSTI